MEEKEIIQNLQREVICLKAWNLTLVDYMLKGAEQVNPKASKVLKELFVQDFVKCAEYLFFKSDLAAQDAVDKLKNEVFGNQSETES